MYIVQGLQKSAYLTHLLAAKSNVCVVGGLDEGGVIDTYVPLTIRFDTVCHI